MTFEPVPDVTGPLGRVRRWLDDRRGPVDLLIAAGLWLFTSAAYLVSYAGLDVGGGELIAMFAVATLQTLPLAWRRTRPELSFALVLAGHLAQLLALVPWATRALGLVAAAPFGPTGRLAVDNAVRNPARAAATTSALLVGVTLVTMTAVGGATARTAVTDFIDGQYPVDVVVQGWSIPDATVDAVARLDGVRATTRLTGTDVTTTDGIDATVAATGDDLARVLRDPGALPDVTDGSVVVPEDGAEAAGLSTGDRLVLQGPDGRVPLTVEVGTALGETWLVTGPALAGLDEAPRTRSVLVRLGDDVDTAATVDAVKEVAAGVDGAQVSGAAPIREANMQVLDIALAVVLALLAISVLIALVGIANTLSLSVIERTRESALLRALGLTRGQLRGMLAIESVLLALVGVVLGSVLGVAYGLAGVRALFGAHMAVAPTLPWGQLAAVALVAVVAGLVASVLPARRAARVSPAQALAAE
ncbi:FtsX-like permease family protein [Janibacter anophelis]|uniref:FtsX-like permease family protein n=1 Tax=Janibacter anophelis TaxID=319054 RepID=UPI0013B0671F|nr:ABC transporter permease [Janibacter anophelis]